MATQLKFERGRLPEAPYPGLRPFEPHEWSIFFGREVMAAAVIEQLGKQNLILVHGASGCGKSSLVRAGVIPALQVDHALNGRRFLHAILRPSDGPLEALAAAFEAALGPVDEGDASKTWLNRVVLDDDLLATIDERLARTDSSFCLIVDQFEEIFRWVEEEDATEAETLVDLMIAVARNDVAGSRFFILTTMRSDYLGQCARFDGFAKVVNDCQYLLDNLDDFGMLRAIHEPAQRFGGRVDPALADRLRAAARHDPDPLPILQHSLMRIYDALGPKDAGWGMTLDELEAVSDEQGALSAHAEEIYKQVVGADRKREEAVEWVFRALIDRDPGGRAIRRPTAFEELVAVSGTSEEIVGEIVGAFSRAGRNLLVVSKPEHGGRVRVDVSHEALIRRWSRIGDQSIDAETGMPAGWLLREVDSGLIWKALAVFARQGEKCLDEKTTKQWLHFFDAVEKRPTWAKRYFVDPMPGLAPEQQPEWLAVMRLIGASRENLRLEDNRLRRLVRRYSVLLAAGFALLLSGTGISAVLSWRQKEDAQARLTEATRQMDSARVVQGRLTTEKDRLQRAERELRRDRTDLQKRLNMSEHELARRSLLLTQKSRRLASMQGRMQKIRALLPQLQQEYDALTSSLAESQLQLSREKSKLRVFYEQAVKLRNADGPANPLPNDFAAGTWEAIEHVATTDGQGVADTGALRETARQIEQFRKEYEIDTDRRLAAFVAFVATQTRRFSSLEDPRTSVSATPAAAEAGPSPRQGPANRAAPRDPEADRYRGRGLIRVRGRNEYAELGPKLGIDLVANPDLLLDVRYAVRAAMELWKSLDGNEFADKEASKLDLLRDVDSSAVDFAGHFADIRGIIGRRLGLGGQIDDAQLHQTATDQTSSR